MDDGVRGLGRPEGGVSVASLLDRWYEVTVPGLGRVVLRYPRLGELEAAYAAAQAAGEEGAGVAFTRVLFEATLEVLEPGAEEACEPNSDALAAAADYRAQGCAAWPLADPDAPELRPIGAGLDA